MASLEAQINQYTTEVEDKEAEIKDLCTQKTQLEDADKKKEIDQRIQALQDDKAELVKLRRELQDKLPGAFGRRLRHRDPHSHTANTPVAACISPFAQPTWRTAVTAVAIR
jgi:hypothetical protein